MNSKIFTKLIFLFFILTAFIFNGIKIENTGSTNNNPQYHPSPVNISNNFLIGYMGNSWEKFAYNGHGANLWHYYLGEDTQNDTSIVYPAGWVYDGADNDYLFSLYNEYVQDVKNELSTINNHNLSALLVLSPTT